MININVEFEDFIRVDKETAALCQVMQKKSGLPEGEFWCLMAVQFYNCRYQHEICTGMGMSKQTVHSALKQLIKRGLIILVTLENNQREKQIVFTEKGVQFVKEKLDRISEAEKAAWEGLTGKEQRELLRICDKLNHLLSAELEQLD